MKPTQETLTLPEWSWQGMKNQLPPSSLSSPWGLQEPCLQSPDRAQGGAGPSWGSSAAPTLSTQLQQVINLHPFGLPSPGGGAAVHAQPMASECKPSPARQASRPSRHYSTAWLGEGHAAQEQPSPAQRHCWSRELKDKAEWTGWKWAVACRGPAATHAPRASIHGH